MWKKNVSYEGLQVPQLEHWTKDVQKTGYKERYGGTVMSGQHGVPREKKNVSAG
jgi:hypothetical protein